MKRKLSKMITALLVFIAPFYGAVQAQQLAFPGAEGFGKYATGGRTGTVVHVTNLNDAGAGSLRDAVSASNRIVVFDVAGVIRISARIVVSPNIYIAGQTAPGEGITVYGNGWSFSGANNSICRYMKIRMGEVGSSGNDANGIANGHDMIFDHCSISWGRDETFSINAPTTARVTIQNTAMTQGLLTHSAGGLIQNDSGITLYRNLYADNGTRNNKIKGRNQYVNNIVYNWSAGAYIMGGDSEGESFANAVSNLFIQGPIPGVRPFSVGNNKYHIYQTDNLHDSDHNGIFNPYVIQQSEFGGGPDFQATPYPYPVLPTVAANTLLDQSLPTVGACLPYRDYVDYYVVNEVKSLGLKGQFIGNETALPFGVPSTWSLWPGTKRIDTDNDGIPDDWETSHNLNPNSAADAMIITANGYTNIENYINGIDASYSQFYLRTPLNLVMDSATQNSISLSWYDYTDKEQGYVIEQKINGVFTQIGTTGVNGNTFTVIGLQPEEKDTFRVRAFAGSNFSAYSNVLAAKSSPIPVAVLNPATFVPDLVWTGAVSTNWDKTTNNWTNNGSAAKFLDSSKLQFNTLPIAQTINLTAQMGAKDMLFKTDVDYTLQGTGNIAGTGSVNKYGTGKLSLLSNNTYTGATVMAGGTLEINKIAYGGLPSSIGASLSYPFNWVWKGGLINYTGGKTGTDRNVSLDATTEFSIANAASTDTMYGVISGSGGLIKSGLGNLVLRSANAYLGETVIKKGTIEVIPLSTATDAQNIIIGGVALGTSNVLRLQGGTFKTSGGSTVANENYPMHIYVEGTDTSGLAPYRNADLSGNVSGTGTLLYTIPYLREIILGDWSEFTGTLIANGSNTTDGSILMIDNGGNGDGIPNARIVATGNTKICTYHNNLSVSLGGLSSDVTGVKLSCGGTKTISFGNGFTTYSVGGANTDETFRGVINDELYGATDANQGTTTIIKEGDGLWRLTNTNVYSGTTTIIGGKLIVNGSNTGAGVYTVTSGTLAGKGNISADVDVADTLQPGDSSPNKFTLKGKLTLESSSFTQVDINKQNNTKDTIAVTGAITYGGTLQVNFTGTPAEGDIFKIFTVGSTQSGNFSAIVPATPGPGLQWLFKPTTGELLVVSPGFVQAPSNLALTTTIDVPTSTATINLTWTDNADNETNFILERSTDGVNFTDINHPVANATTYQDKNLAPLTTYYYRIKAVGASKTSTYSNVASIKTPSLFSAPDVVTNPNPTNAQVDVPLLAGGNLNLSWSGSTNTNSYAVYFGTVAGSLTKVADVPYSTNPTYQITGLSNYGTYYWRVDATNATGTTTGTQWNFRTVQAAPVAGDYRSLTTGGWGTVATWQTFDGTNWVAATAIPGGNTPTVTIRNGHTVSLNATTVVNNVIVEPTGNLKSDGTNRNLRIVTGVTSYGVFGGTGTAGDRINFEGYEDNGTITLGGSTTYYLNSFGVNPIAVNVNVVIDANLNVNNYFRAYYSNGTTTGQDDDNVTITLNEGKTVTMTSGSYLCEVSSGSTNTTNTISTFGNYTYNFNGVFDMRASTSNTSSVVAHSTKANSKVVFNINGTWYTGGAMRLVSNLGAGVLPAGSIAFNIGDKGAVDARGNGTTNTNIVTSNSTNGQVLFFNITGNGVERYRVGNANVTYAIGSNNTYSPVILNNSGTTDLIAVGVKNTFENGLNNANRAVQKQYTITPATVGATNLAISLGWLASDQASGFSPTTSVIGHFGNNIWDETTATVSGAGTVLNPYFAKASGFTSFSPFGVGNANAFVKLAPIAFTGCPNINLVVARPGYNTYTTEPLNFYNLDTATGVATVIPGGPLKDAAATKNIELNGAGVNGTDGFVYGIRDTINTAGTAQAAMLYRVGSNYGSDMLGNLAAPILSNGENLAVVNPSAGTFDDQGNFYYIGITGSYSFIGNSFTPSNYYIGKVANVAALTAGSTLAATWTKIDFTAAPAAYKSSIYSVITSASGTGAGKSFQDLTYSNLYRSFYVYAAYNAGAGYTGQLLAINPTNGVATFYANPPAFGAANNEVAGISTTASGNLRMFTTAGDIYKPVMAGADFTSTFTKIGNTGITPSNGIGSIRGDLASCGVGSATLPTSRPNQIVVGLPSQITAFPNPAQGLTTITVGQRLLNATVKLLDLAGNVIAEKSGVAGYTFQMDMTGKAGGLYTIEVTQGGNTQVVKVMKP